MQVAIITPFLIGIMVFPVKIATIRGNKEILLKGNKPMQSNKRDSRLSTGDVQKVCFHPPESLARCFAYSELQKIRRNGKKCGESR